MKFLADEDIAQLLIKIFREAGHDVLDTKEKDLRGFTDTSLIKLANTEKRIILTHDKDFLELERTSKVPFKFILLRIVPTTREKMILAANFVLKDKLWEEMKSSAVVNLVGGQIFVSTH